MKGAPTISNTLSDCYRYSSRKNYLFIFRLESPLFGHSHHTNKFTKHSLSSTKQFISILRTSCAHVNCGDGDRYWNVECLVGLVDVDWTNQKTIIMTLCYWTAYACVSAQRRDERQRERGANVCVLHFSIEPFYTCILWYTVNERVCVCVCYVFVQKQQTETQLIVLHKSTHAYTTSDYLLIFLLHVKKNEKRTRRPI